MIALNTTRSTSTNLKLDETGIAWKSDRVTNFLQVAGFTSQLNPSGANCDTLLGKNGAKSYTDAAGLKHCFWYPQQAQMQYLYETYPQISPLLGVTDEHFIVWMKTASLPTFRKLYGKLDGDFKKGDMITFDVTANFFVGDIAASKALVLTASGEFGSLNMNFGIVYLAVGGFCMLLFVILLCKQTIAPRADGYSLVEQWNAEEIKKSAQVGVVNSDVTPANGTSGEAHEVGENSALNVSRN